MRPVAQATVTPLASIFGSGFLVVVPVLASAVGPYSVGAIAGVLLLAYGVGGVIRHNITIVEPALRDDPPRAAVVLERASAVALVFAYVLSVCLYLHILAAFALRAFDADSAVNKSVLVTGAVATIVILGVVGGTKRLEALEKYALAITLAIAALLLLAFAYFDIRAAGSTPGLVFVDVPNREPFEALRVVAGTLIVVQGFETTRYLGNRYDAEVRVRASRWSQWISAGVYIAFVALAMPLVPGLHGEYDADSLFDLTLLASALLPIPLVVAAAVSQFSAAVADAVAAAGGIEEVSGGRLKRRWAYIGIGAAAIVLAWSGDTLTIIAWASRAFALYYLLQCFVALTVCPFARRKVWISVVAVALLFVTIFAEPAG